MLYSIYYQTKAERRDAIGIAESNGHQMIHDNYFTGPNKENELIFESSPVKDEIVVPPPTPEIIRIGQLRQKLAQTREDLNALPMVELMELLRLERGL
jgi:hypothetical protein